MSFQTGLSGLNASSRSLDVIGNNIANANTTGMKSSRAEFSDLVASSLGAGGGTNGPGIGVAVQTISQQFSQGNITTSGNSLDVAINGGGFFQLTQTDGSTAYTRDGAFKLNKDGYLVTNTGANIMGYPTDKLGNPTSASVQKLQLPTNAPIAASATTTITAEFNLDARALSTSPRSTYGTSLTLYDTQGSTVPVSLYFVKAAPTNPASTTDDWQVYDSLLPAAPALFTMSFDQNGVLTSPVAGSMPVLTVATPSAVTPPILATLDLSKVTQFGAAFAMTSLTQDGYAPGELASLSIGESGVITARYSNGQTQYNGKITLADFRNVQGLSPLGGNAWAATIDSGQPMQGSPSEGKYGALRAGALEESNVDLTSELVNMMTAQRAYQANAQTIKTQDQIMSTLVNLR
jgi:flagellar hook protein FlgE